MSEKLMFLLRYYQFQITEVTFVMHYPFQKHSLIICASERSERALRTIVYFHFSGTAIQCICIWRDLSQNDLNAMHNRIIQNNTFLMIPFSLYIRNILEVMIKSITNFLIIFFIFQQLKSQISQIDQNGVKPFCDETLHFILPHGNINDSLTDKLLTTYQYRETQRASRASELWNCFAFICTKTPISFNVWVGTYE